MSSVGSDEDLNEGNQPGPSVPSSGRRKKARAPKRRAENLSSFSVSPKKKRRAVKNKSDLLEISLPLTPLIPTLTPDDLYYPGGCFFDLGYVTDSLKKHGFGEEAWSCRCYNFTFIFDSTFFENLPVEKQSFFSKVLSSLTHFRVIWSQVGGLDQNAGEDAWETGGAILIPPRVAQLSGLPLVINGRLQFLNAPPAGRPAGWVDWRNEGSENDVPLPVDALRHFAVKTLNGTEAEEGLEEIRLPSLPKAEKTKFQLKGETFPNSKKPRLLHVLTDKKPLFFVFRSVEAPPPIILKELVIDVFMTESFFAEEEGSVFEMKNNQRLRFLLDSFRPATITNNSFLEKLILEKHYKPNKQETTKNHFFGDKIDPKNLHALFAHVKSVHAHQCISPLHNPQHPWLRLQMHDYQKRAVTWMTSREKSVLQNLTFPHPLFFPRELEKNTIEFDKNTIEFKKNTIEFDKNTNEFEKNIIEFEKNTIELEKNANESEKTTDEFEKNINEVDKKTDEFEKNINEVEKNTEKNLQKTDITLYMHYTTGQITRTIPELNFPRGGILADEMGLGKTLETISLILTNQKQNLKPHLPKTFKFPKIQQNISEAVVFCHCPVGAKNSELIACAKCGLVQHAVCMMANLIPEGEMFLCSSCQREHRIECKTTLVVAPAAIISQWQSEIVKSCKENCVSVFEYKGISKERFVSPWKMAQYDVIVASYEMLSHEMLWVQAEVRKASLRRERRCKLNNYQIIPSPLLSMTFWRFILDEAQMVESQSAHYAQMAMKIHAHFYWAVTGTPIQKGISDLQALLQFVEMTPWNSPSSFENYLAGPFREKIPEPLQDVLGECMWRLEKEDVEGEMGLPVCRTVMHHVHFSGIEKQLYQQVYRDCIQQMTSRLRRHPTIRVKAFDMPFTALSLFDSQLVKIIKDWMGYLAKLCTSPTRVSYFFKVARRIKNAPVKEDEGLDALGRVSRTLAEKAKLDFTNAFRVCIMERNALAALFWLNEEYENAAEEYRKGKRMCSETEEDVPVDVLQKFHILKNLGQLLEEKGDKISGRALDDSDLLSQAEALRQGFVARKRGALDASRKELENVWENGPPTPTYLDKAMAPVYRALNFVDVSKHPSFLNDRKLASLGTSSAVEFDSVRSRALPSNYESIEGLKYVLQSRWEEITKERMSICVGMQTISRECTNDADTFAQHSSDCHLRPGVITKKCPLCVVERSFDAYEDLIYRTQMQMEEVDLEDAVLTGRPQGSQGSYGSMGSLGSYGMRRKFDTEEEGRRHTDQSDGDFELTVKSIVQFMRSRCSVKCGHDTNFLPLEPSIQELLHLITVMKKEYQLWRDLWRSIYDYTAGCDELKQAVLRLRFMTSEEEEVQKALKKTNKNEKTKNDFLFRWLIPSNDNLNLRINHAHIQVAASMEQMTRTWTHFKYTRNMNQAYTQKEKVQEKECIVCYEAVGTKWAMFPCAHVICEDCLKIMAGQGQTNANISNRNTQQETIVACPVCRKIARTNEILTQKHVQNCETQVEEHKFNAKNLRGAPSKVEMVVRTVFGLVEEDSSVKILIFSDYADVLEDYANILNRNAISAHLVKSKGLIPAAIGKLRQGTVQILLMPISLGGKGLTITEANHLFFLEPLTNKGAELQAIGRIHRMGQTRPTFVHKFIVTDTVEERIDEMMRTVGEEGSLSQKDLTLGQIVHLLKRGEGQGKGEGHHGPDMDDLSNWLNQARQAKQNENLTPSTSNFTPSTSTGSTSTPATSTGSTSTGFAPSTSTASTSTHSFHFWNAVFNSGL